MACVGVIVYVTLPLVVEGAGSTGFTRVRTLRSVVLTRGRLRSARVLAPNSSGFAVG